LIDLLLIAPFAIVLVDLLLIAPFAIVEGQSLQWQKGK
jgi:hypothetical protein